MSIFVLGRSSESNLIGVKEPLFRVTRRALTITPYDFGVSCGLRTLDEQHERVLSGASQSVNSRHLDGHAVDIIVYDKKGVYVNGDTEEEVGMYRKVMQAFVTAAIEEQVQIELGALWRTFVDAGHVQLSWKYYPKEGT